MILEDKMEMIEKQRLKYEFYSEAGWEFSHWEGDSVIMVIWYQDTLESRSLLGRIRIAPDGKRYDATK